VIILRKSVDGLGEVPLARFVTRAKRYVKLDGAVNVLVTGSGEVRGLNRRFRSVDKPTDVLAFPPLAELGAGLGGDIAISADIAARNARELGHSAGHEIKILVLHGLLHLAGYDHERDKGEMARKEFALRKSLHLPGGLIERNGAARTATVKSRKPRSAR
jgi:probable rRNA maturation factor